ncbi:ATP-dependent DNA ligase [Herbiconiux sp.]|uniref:ATP-dependent DNA ligase n=1 Tax=Herbiconiux sp. TaxID=1871186 RepID=UPI0025C42879|nr:ATP-dependent DNA ligase [Herbiconiux sp.]
MTSSAAAPVSPMLAKAVSAVPDQGAVEGGFLYEPKWDGFRGIVVFDGESIEIGSRGSKPLTRYFPELTSALADLLPAPCVLDGEIVVPTGDPGRQRLDWEALSQRIHPAESRIRTLSKATPAVFVAFDLLSEAGDDLLEKPFGERREALEAFMARVPATEAEGVLALSRTTRDVELARRWLVEFEGAGLDGVVAKPLAAPYAPGKRVLQKIKHRRTADVVVTGYRVHTSGTGVGSLLLGLYGDDGELHQAGGASAFTDKRRRELIDELEPLVVRGDDGEVVRAEGERNRFSSKKDVSFVPLEPRLVVEVRYDQMEGTRFRHTVQIERWRIDREPESCRFDQLEQPEGYDLAEVLGTP